MDIIIKSFNRPYYLDRCLFSIKKNIKGFNNIIILDDGTPEKYLVKIQERYPKVKILKSDFYTIKSNALPNLKTLNIPIDFWVNSIKKASDYFLLLEDDYWVTENLDLEKINSNLKEKNIVFLKLYWLGNVKLKPNKIKEALKEFNIISSGLITNSPFLFKLIYRTYSYGFEKIMRFFKLNTLNNILPYYNIYSVAGAIFKKEYFTQLWHNHNSCVDESLQLLNALKYFKKHSQSLTACAKKEYFKTGFKSSATFGIKNSNSKNNLALLKVNSLLNEAWLNNEFNTTKNLPNDIQDISILNILNKTDKEMAIQWQDWINKFKQKYQDFGCKIE